MSNKCMCKDLLKVLMNSVTHWSRFRHFKSKSKVCLALLSRCFQTISESEYMYPAAGPL